MLAGLKRFLTPLVFEGDEEKTRVARLLHIILMAAVALTAMLIVLVVPIVIQEPNPLPNLAGLGLISLPTVMAVFLLRRGNVRPAGLIFTSAMWLAIVSLIVFTGGMSSSGFTGLIVVILIVGLLLGGPAAIGLAGLTVLATAGILYAEINRRLPPPLTSEPVSTWATHMVNFVMAAVLLHLATLSLQEALERARRNERAQLEANQALAVLSASLEQRVAERTRELEASNVQLQRAYEDLQVNQEKLLIAEKMASLGRLTAGIAHEMNTPLAAVRVSLADLSRLGQEYESSIGDSQVTAEDYHAITEEMLHAVHLAQKAAERAASFVRSIKSQTRDLASQEPQRFDAVPVIQETLLLLGYALRHARCSDIFEPAIGRVELYGSPGRLAQVVTNLVTNAIDASVEQGGGPINLRLTPGPEGVELKVSDQGSGIPPEVLSKIFDPMFTTKPFGQGMGLGLSIVHDIVTSDFGGTIEVESQVGQGTTFTLWFPNRLEV